MTQTTSDHLDVQLCPRFHRAVELIGRRWTGAVIRVLLGGPRRFNELLGSIPGISDRLLTERLRELEGEGLITRNVEPGSPVKVVYALTCAGAELQESMDAIGRWAERWGKAPD
ncbi:MAG: helix-turn-helix transcriptional regulator [bacterium]|nr:helix-turn-helix transcriptional regulator [bacterium]